MKRITQLLLMTAVFTLFFSGTGASPSAPAAREISLGLQDKLQTDLREMKQNRLENKYAESKQEYAKSVFELKAASEK